MCAASATPLLTTFTPTKTRQEASWSATTRAFGSRDFAEAISEVLAASGIVVHLSDDYTPTPALSYAVVNSKAAGGVMITSSHNPWNWNGVKYKAGYGGSATPAIIKSIEGALDAPEDEAARRQSSRRRFQDSLHRRDQEIRRS